MGVVLLHILQWILRIILFLLLLLLILVVVVMIVPIRYRMEGEVLEKKPKVTGKITWFFYLLYMSFAYEERFCMQVKVFGFEIFSTKKEENKEKKKEVEEDVFKSNSSEYKEEVFWKESLEESESGVKNQNSETLGDSVNDDRVMQKQSVENVTDETGENALQQLEERQRSESAISTSEIKTKKQKKTLIEKINSMKFKIQGMIQKIKDIICKIQEGKLKIEHYLELWERKATQITFQRAKRKLRKMISAILPRKWILTGEIGFENPCTTGQFMGVLGVMYPILGSKVCIVPNFEQDIMNIKGEVKGHIRLGNIVYQVISFLLNRHCFKLIKMILDELSGSKKSEKEI